MIKTTLDYSVDCSVVSNYFSSLVNRFFKILPMREQEEKSLSSYIESLQNELIGFGELTNFKADTSFITLLSILEFFKCNPDTDVKNVKRDVFKAISICKKIESRLVEEVDK